MLKGRLGLETARIPHADRHGLVWLVRGNLVADDGTITFRTAGFADLPAGTYGIPHQTVSFILLGPGSTLSHDAARILARHGTGVAMVGEGGVRLYASLPPQPDQATRARAQALAERAEGELEALPPGAGRDALRGAITYVVERRR